MAPEIGPKTFGSFEKRAPVPCYHVTGHSVLTGTRWRYSTPLNLYYTNKFSVVISSVSVTRMETAGVMRATWIEISKYKHRQPNRVCDIKSSYRKNYR